MTVAQSLGLALVWAAAIYRIIFSLRHDRTVWRSAFTLCAVCLAVGATLAYYGEPLEGLLGVWNLGTLLSEVTLVVAAGATLVYVATLESRSVPRLVLRAWIAATGAVTVAITIAWLMAPIHSQSYPDITLLAQHRSVAAFREIYYAYLMVAMFATARICFLRALDRHDVVRSISMTFSGAGCAAGFVSFASAAVVVGARHLEGTEPPGLMRFAHVVSPLALVMLALGTLTLAAAPGLVLVIRSYMQWRCLRPLWQEMVRLRPEVHLDGPALGGPSRRSQLKVQRALLEIRDALRLIHVPVGPDADVDELGRVLRHRQTGGSRVAAEVLGRAATREDDMRQILTLARAYEEADR